ncbi:unnamed protein product [Orchesella dallaii]|uniref:Kazal-like domain-containing protein n=1 Tax=Orchesella dallaii TaxID=48710 RepID=A0ABP1RBI4_9HEXA
MFLALVYDFSATAEESEEETTGSPEDSSTSLEEEEVSSVLAPPKKLEFPLKLPSVEKLVAVTEQPSGSGSESGENDGDSEIGKEKDSPTAVKSVSSSSRGSKECPRCARKRTKLICGRDGKTYRNKCEMKCKAKGVLKAYNGECNIQNVAKHGMKRIFNGISHRIANVTGDSTACEKCSKKPTKWVCGNDGKTQRNKCELKCKGIELEHKGKCKTSSTPSFIKGIPAAIPLPGKSDNKAVADKESDATPKESDDEEDDDDDDEPEESDDTTSSPLSKTKLKDIIPIKL